MGSCSSAFASTARYPDRARIGVVAADARSVVGVGNDVPSSPQPSAVDVARTRELQSVWGVIPTLFVNLWPLYQPEFHAYLLQFWAGVSLSWWIAGSVAIVLTARRVTGEDERRLMRRLVIALVAALGIGIHNVFVRNWGYWFGFSPPVVFSTVSLVAEAVAFTLLAGTLVYSVIRRLG